MRASPLTPVISQKQTIMHSNCAYSFLVCFKLRQSENNILLLSPTLSSTHSLSPLCPSVSLVLLFCVCVVDQARGQHLQLQYVPQCCALPHRTRRWDLNASPMNQLHNLNFTLYCWGQQMNISRDISWLRNQNSPFCLVFMELIVHSMYYYLEVLVFIFTLLFIKSCIKLPCTVSFMIIHLFQTIRC